MRLKNLAKMMSSDPVDLESDAPQPAEAPDDAVVDQEASDGGHLSSDAPVVEADAAPPARIEPESLADLIDSLGDTLNELGEDAEMVNGDDDGRTYEDYDLDDETSAESDDDDDEVDASTSIEDRHHLSAPTFLENARMSWDTHRSGHGDTDLASSIDENWKPHWMFSMLLAAVLVGFGTMLIVTSTGDEQAPQTAAPVGDIPTVGTCYAIDNLGGSLVTACSSTYKYQVVATYQLTGDQPPKGELSMIDSQLRCLDQLAISGGRALPPDSEMIAIVPSEFEFVNGQRTVVCEVHAQGPTVLSGSML
jgi:hypothetical protein